MRARSIWTAVQQTSTLRRLVRSGAALTLFAMLVSGCHKKPKQTYSPPPPPDISGQQSQSRRAPARPSDVPPANSSVEVPRGKPSWTETGLASWYGPPYAGRKGADGTVYDQNAMTAANLTLPLGTIVRVTNVATGQSIVVRITDRGPFVHGRIIDLSLAAAKATGVYRAGVAKVKLEAYLPANSATTIPGGRWCVQIGAFYDPADALQLKNDLARRYKTAKVIEFAGPTGHWVRINPAQPDKTHAIEIADSIHIPDAEPYVTRLD